MRSSTTGCARAPARPGTSTAPWRVPARSTSARSPALLANPYFDLPPPKSLDRNDFDPAPLAKLSDADGAATLTAFTAAAAARAREHFPAPPKHWLATGGGRRNPVLMAALSQAFGWEVLPVEFGRVGRRRARGAGLRLSRGPLGPEAPAEPAEHDRRAAADPGRAPASTARQARPQRRVGASAGGECGERRLTARGPIACGCRRCDL